MKSVHEINLQIKWKVDPQNSSLINRYKKKYINILNSTVRMVKIVYYEDKVKKYSLETNNSDKQLMNQLTQKKTKQFAKN